MNSDESYSDESYSDESYHSVLPSVINNLADLGKNLADLLSTS